MNGLIKFLQKNMIWEVLFLVVFSTLLGKYYHNLFVSLKTILPLALFLMLYKPMVYLDIGKALTKMTDIKKKYLITLTVFYILIFPFSAYLLMKLFFLIMPSIDPNIVAGIVILSLSPIASSAPAFVSMSKGKVQLAVVGVIYTFFLSLIVIPLGSKLILNQTAKVPIASLFKSLAIYVIFPLIIGQATKYAIIKYMGIKTLENLKSFLDVLVLIGLFTMVFIVFGINSTVIINQPQTILYGLIIMNLYFLLRWSLAYIIGNLLKIPFEQNIALTYSSTYNMSISTAISIATFGSIAGIGTIIGGPFAEMIQMILLVKFFEYLRKY